MTYPYFLQRQQHQRVYHNSDFRFLKKQKQKQANKQKHHQPKIHFKKLHSF